MWREGEEEGKRGGSGLAFWLEYFALIPKKTTKIQVNSNNCKSSLVWITATWILDHSVFIYTDTHRPARY